MNLKNTIIKTKKSWTLRSKVKITGYETSEYPKHLPGWMIIRMRDGTFYEHRIKFERGCLENPIPEEDIRAKYFGNASRALPDKKLKEIEKLVDGLEELDDVSRLIELCY